MAEQVFKFLALICVIAVGGYIKFNYCRKPYSECSSDEKRIRRVGAVICGLCALFCIAKIIMSR